MIQKIPDGRLCGKIIPHYRPDQAQLVVFAGKRGMGKTTAIQSYVDVREYRLLLIDHYDDFPDVPLADSLGVAILDLQDAWPGPCRRRIVPYVGGEHKDMIEYADMLWRACHESVRDCLIVANEIVLLSKPTASLDLTTFVTQARRRGLRLVCDAQRLSLVPYLFQSECTQLVLFRITRPRDRLAVADWAESEDIAQLVSKLDVGECICLEL